LQAKVFYQPSDQGAEAALRTDVERRREAQLAAMLDREIGLPFEGWTHAQDDPRQEAWLRRTVSSIGARLAQVREAVVELADLRRHHLVLDLAAGSGLLTWEAVRRVPEGCVYAASANLEHVSTLQQRAERLDVLQRPFAFHASPSRAPSALSEARPGVVLDVVIGRDVTASIDEPVAWLGELGASVAPEGVLVLADTDAARAPRPSQWLRRTRHDAWADAFAEAEARVFDAFEPWNEARWAAWFSESDWRVRVVRDVASTSEVALTPALVRRWFGTEGAPGRFAQALANVWDDAEVDEARVRFEASISGEARPWRTVTSIVRAKRDVR